jgi:zinc transport system substrate-binding protein
MSSHRTGFLNALMILGVIISITACSDQPERDSAPKPTARNAKLAVYVVNYPLMYFAERIGGKGVNVTFPAPAHTDPAFWMPDAGTVGAYQRANLIVLNGANYAKWVDRVSLPQAKLVNTSKGFQDQYISIESAITHAHGPQGEHSHGAIAFTTWLDPKLAIEQARTIKQAFVRLRPDQQKAFQAGFDALERDLLDLDTRINEIVSANTKQPLVASHPVYQYLMRRYGLNVRSVHWEPDEVPNDNMWKELTDLLVSHPAKWMIWEGAPLPGTARKLERLDVKSTVFDPCGNVPQEGDYLSIMRQNASNLALAFPQ